jgi:hypothetical protein
MQASHPLGVAVGQIVVDRDDVDALAGQRIEVGGQRGDQRLAFAGAHFGDLAVVQDHAADQLHIEVAHAEGALAGLAHDREGLRQERVQRLALGHAFLEFAVLPRSASSDSALIPSSSALILRTACEYCLISRSLRLPKIFLSRPGIILGTVKEAAKLV